MKVSIKSGFGRLKNACLLASLVVGCSSSDSGPKDAADAPARRVLLENMAKRVIGATYADFTTKARALSDAVDAYAVSQGEDELREAQAAFREAMQVWQRAEVFQVGPAAAVGSATPGGQGLRQELYFWPQAYPCGVDVALVQKAYADGDAFIADSFPNVRGLSALERLLFARDNDSACPSDNPIIESGDWTALTESDIDARRAAYAKLLASEVEKNARALEKSFGAFVRELATAGKGSKLFDTTQDALNAVSDAMFYLDTQSKDLKLAAPLGLSMSCDEKRCPADLELPLSLESKRALLSNLEAFRDLFQGLPPKDRGEEMWGFADLLASVSQQKLADKMKKLIATAIAETEKIEPNLEEVVASDASEPPSSARATQADRAYAAIQELTMVLKTEFISALSLKLPVVAASDND